MIAVWIVMVVAAIASVVFSRTYWAALVLVLGWLGWMAWLTRHAWSMSASVGDAIATFFLIAAVAYLIFIAALALWFTARYFKHQAEIDDRRLEARKRYDEIYGPDGGIGDWPFYIPPMPDRGRGSK